MTVTSSTVKRASRKIFKENFIDSIVATIIVLMTWFICYYLFVIVTLITESAVSYAVLAFSFPFIVLPCCLGLVRYYWRMASGVVDNPVCVFYYFSSRFLYAKALKLLLSLLFRTVFCFAIFYLPALVLELITGSWLYKTLDVTMPIWTVNLSNLIYFLYFIAFVATVFSMLKFYMAPMLLVADENMDPAEALHMSSVVSKRTSLDFVFLCLSFLGWILLSLLSMPLIFTLPYMILAYLLHCSHAVNTFNEEISNINFDEIPTFIAGV